MVNDSNNNLLTQGHETAYEKCSKAVTVSIGFLEYQR